jgi:ribosomal protein S18 acetylase RimI-like enzyme
MLIRPIQSSEFDAAYHLLRSNGWGHRLGTLASFVDLLRASQRVIVAIDAAGQVVGLVRALTDGLSNGYLSMVVVAPGHRRQGVGRALVAAATEGHPEVS